MQPARHTCRAGLHSSLTTFSNNLCVHYILIYCVKTPIFPLRWFVACKLYSEALFVPERCRAYTLLRARTHTHQVILPINFPLKKKSRPMKTTPKSTRLFVARKSMSAPRAVHIFWHIINPTYIWEQSWSVHAFITLNFLICAHDLTLHITKVSRSSSLQVMYDIKIGMDESRVCLFQRNIPKRDAFNYTPHSGWDRTFQIVPRYF